MPSIDVADPPPATPEHPDRVFKSHKSLPRRTNVLPDDRITQLPRADHHDQNPNGLPLTTAPILPLTPPGISQDESHAKPTPSHSVVPALTPETTPPRGTTSHRPGLSQLGYISCSSRAESFSTAYEMISNDETRTPQASPLALSRSSTQRSTKSTKNSQGINGHGRTGAAKKAATAERQSPSSRGSPRVKGPSSVKPASINAVSKQELTNGATPGIRIKPTRGKSERSRKTINESMAPNASTRDRSSLRGRINHVQPAEDDSALDQFRQKIGWPSAADHSSTDPDESRRHSGVSTSSTVEAMIVDAPKPAHRALRHTEKRSSLRSASSPITKSERTSIASSTDLRRRLSHKPARISQNDRKSIASELSVSGSSTLGAPQQSVDVVPVVVIPQRHSSLMGSSNPSSRNPSVSRSQTSGRAPTEGKSPHGYSDHSRRRKRTMSDSHASKIPVDLRGRGMGRPPKIPPRSSSLSAPTSQNNSRATSLTTDSLRSHNLALEQVAGKHKPERAKPTPIHVPVLDTPMQNERGAADNLKPQSIIGAEESYHLRPPSVPFTPHSIPSLSPGPFEINEAKTVSIFPHNNESLLLVNPYKQTGLQQLGKPRTNEITQQASADADSPLKNPRPPPQPPVSAAIANFRNFDQLQAELTKEPESMSSTTRLKNKRPGLAARPRSESFNSFVRTLSLRSAKNPKAGENIDGRLQPFWRPRRFWDDSPGSLSPEEDGPQSRATKKSDEVISNSLGMPQKQLVFNGPPFSVSREGTNTRIDGYLRASRENLVGSRIFTPEALYSQTSLHQRQISALSWWRLRLRSGVVRSLRRRFRRSMQRRAEGKREVRRENLKKSIGGAVLMDSSTQVQKGLL